MTTRYDIIDAKAAYTKHLADHRCVTGDGCKERLRLLKAYNGGPRSVAGRWDLDDGDHDRQERQYHERTKGIA